MVGRMLGGFVGAVLALAVATGQAPAQVRIGIVTTLSGPGATLGQQLRDGFALGVDAAGGTLGGMALIF